MTFIQAIQRHIEPADHADISAAALTRNITTWVFNLARNLIVIGALTFVAERSKSIYVEGALATCRIFLFLYILSYWQQIYIRTLSKYWKTNCAEFIDLIINVSIGLLISYCSFMAVSAIAETLAHTR